MYHSVVSNSFSHTVDIGFLTDTHPSVKNHVPQPGMRGFRCGEGRASKECCGEVSSPPRASWVEAGVTWAFRRLALGVGCRTALLLMANGGEGKGWCMWWWEVLLCRCAQQLGERGSWGSGRAVGDRWCLPGTHNPKTALRCLVCPALFQTPENCV